MDATASPQSVVAAAPSAAIYFPLPPLHPPALLPRAARPSFDPLDPALDPLDVFVLRKVQAERALGDRGDT
eukprot:213910-Chlamydomonas_euryale.AAC.1